MANIGDFFEGGIIFYTGDTTTYIASLEDYIIPLYWGCYGVGIADTSAEIDAGSNNTTLIVAGCTGNTMIAATICDNLDLSGYTDWYLPSKDELNQIYLLKNLIGNFSTYDNYWSSTQNTPETAWIQFFKDGTQGLGGKDQLYRVRPVRVKILV